MLTQAEHKKTAQDLGIHSPPNPAHAPQSPYPNLSPRGMRTEVDTKKKDKTNRSTQRPRRQGHPLQWADTGDHDGRRVARMEEAVKSHHQVVSPSGMRTEAGTKKTKPNKSTQRPCRQGRPLQRAGTYDRGSRRVSRVEEAGKSQHQAVPTLNPYIGHSNPVSLVPVRQGDHSDSLRQPYLPDLAACMPPWGLNAAAVRVTRRCGVPPMRAATSRTARSKNQSLSAGRGHWGHRRTPLPSSTRRIGRCATLPRRRLRSTVVHFAARRCLASADRR